MGFRALTERRVACPSVRVSNCHAGWQRLSVFVRPALQPYFRQIIMTLLTRMQQNKTNNFVYYFAYFLLYLLAINTEGLTPDYLIQTVDEIQPGYRNRFSSCADQGLTGFQSQAVVSNRLKLHRTSNRAASPERPQSGSCWPNTAAHAKHARVERTQCENMVRHASLPRGGPLWCSHVLLQARVA